MPDGIARARTLPGIQPGVRQDVLGGYSHSGPSGIFERTRACPWDTVEAGYPPFYWANWGGGGYSPTYYGYAPRILGKDGTDKFTSSAKMYQYFFGLSNSSIPSGATAVMPDGSGGSFTPFFPCYVNNDSQSVTVFGESSSLCDLWRIPSSIATNFDIIQKDGIDYVILQTYSSTSLMVARKG